MRSIHEKGTAVKQISLLFSLAFLISVPFAVIHTGERDVLSAFMRILFSPCPLVTDYYRLGSLPATFLNAGLCGLACTALFFLLDDGQLIGSNWAGYFLVIAHCFYGLNLLNMWPPVLGIFVYCKFKKLQFRNHLDIAMFSTAFGPFISELLFRYPIQFNIPFSFGPYTINLYGIFSSLLLGLFLGFTIPAMLPGAKILHKGFNLYNAGLAFGLLGFMIFSFLYRSFGLRSVEAVFRENIAYDQYRNGYFLFCNSFFLVMFLICILIGFFLNGRSFKGYGKLLSSDKLGIDYIIAYNDSLCWINIGLYGLMILLYLDAIILITDGAGWTGATCGVTLAAMSFAAAGQNPKNVLPIIIGYIIVFVSEIYICTVLNIPLVWSLSTQSYINGFAFATGLCPYSWYFGPLAGVLAGVINAVLCTATSQLHGGLVLYNGGLTAGLTALILTPILVLYWTKKE